MCIRDSFFRICSESLEKRRRPGIHGQDAGDAAHLADLTSSGDFAPPVELVVRRRCGAGSSIISIAPDGKVCLLYTSLLRHFPLYSGRHSIVQSL